MKPLQTPRLLLLAATTHAAASLAAAGTVSITDSFKAGASDHGSGVPLAGAFTEQGNVRWEAHPADYLGILFSSGGAITPGSEKGSSASVPLPDGARQVSITADLKPGGCDWTGISLGGPALDTHYFSPRGASLTLLLRESGHYTLVARAHKPIKLAESQLANFSASRFTRAELSYDRDTNSVSVRFNDELVHHQIDLNQHELQPLLTRAGVRFNPPSRPGVPEIDNVSIFVTR